MNLPVMFRLLTTIILLAMPLTGSAGAMTADDWLARADEREAKGDSQGALEALKKADDLEPDQAEILVRIAKQHGDLMTRMRDPEERKMAAETSLVYSRRALELDPRLGDAHLSVAISLGKSTEFMGNREKIETSREIRERAERALELNPECDYAHHMLGRWHQELAGIGTATRALARVIYGGLPSASYDEALHHLGRARELRPDRLLHRIEYGRTLAMMGREAEARKLLAESLEMPERDMDDAEAKDRGRATLHGIGG